MNKANRFTYWLSGTGGIATLLLLLYLGAAPAGALMMLIPYGLAVLATLLLGKTSAQCETMAIATVPVCAVGLALLFVCSRTAHISDLGPLALSALLLQCLLVLVAAGICLCLARVRRKHHQQVT